MCCLVTLLAILGPRVALLYWWLTDQVRWALTFDNNVLLPLVGFLFAPWTTMAYVLVWQAGGLDGGGWVVVGLAFLADLVSIGGGGYTNRGRFPDNRMAV